MIDREWLSTRINEELKRHFDEAGRGTTRRVERELGRAKGYFLKWFNGQQVFDFLTLLDALGVLGVDPWDFFRKVCGDAKPDDDSQGCQAAERPAAKRATPKLRPSRGPETMCVPEWIDELDELRYHDAEAAIRGLWSRAGDAKGSKLTLYLGALGSAYRSIGYLDEARECLHKAEARALDDLGYGDALQRQSYLVLHDGDVERALRLSREAAGVFAGSRLWVRFGECHVDQAALYGHLGQAGRRWVSLDIADEYLAGAPPGPRLRRNLFAVGLYRAMARTEADEQGEAVRLASAALEIANTPQERSACWMLVGKAHRKSGRFAEACVAFRQARLHAGDDPINALVATIEIVQSLAVARRNKEAVEEAESTGRLLGGLAPSSLVRAAAYELWQQARKRRLAIATLDRVRKTATAETSAPTPLSLGNRLALARRLSGYSRTAVADSTGVPLPTLKGLEAGTCGGPKHTPALEQWIRAIRPDSAL